MRLVALGDRELGLNIVPVLRKNLVGAPYKLSVGNVYWRISPEVILDVPEPRIMAVVGMVGEIPVLRRTGHAAGDSV